MPSQRDVRRDDRMNLFVGTVGVGNALAAWRSTRTSPESAHKLDYFAEVASIAESGRFDAVFVADFLALGPAAKYDVQERLDPVTLLASLAGRTRDIGLIGTSSTTYNDPYTIARQFATLDHLSDGRAGWNIVTTMVPAAAANFGSRPHPEHDARYVVAEEFVDVVVKLWDSWDADAIIADAQSGVYLDVDRVHRIAHEGEHFAVMGPLNIPRPPQGRPVLVQAGSSDAGMRLAARHAEVVFTTQYDLRASQAFVVEMRNRVGAFGRDPANVRILPGLAPIVGRTHAQARELANEISGLTSPEAGFPLMTSIFGGLDLGEYELDAPFPDIRERLPANAPRSRAELFIRMADDEGLTLRQVMQRIASSSGHRVLVGSADEIAADMITWFDEHAADGFNILPTDLPEGLRDFVELVVPRLQHHGVFRSEYASGGLRETLGITNGSLA